MRLGKYMMAAAAATMAVAPAMAAPGNPASSLSVAHSARAGSKATNQSDLAGGGFIVAIIAGVLVIVGIVVVAQEDSKPKSP